MRSSGQRQRGITLLELLVAVALIGVLAGILLPAVQAAREMARKTHCQNNLRQLAIAMHAHIEAHGSFPSGGWGFAWVGVPGRGSGKQQPGGWAYSLLPYLELSALYDLGAGAAEAELRAMSAKRLQIPVPLFNCPSRRSSASWPTTTDRPHLRNPRLTDTVLDVVRSDYAANGGDVYESVIEGPLDLVQGDRSDYPWPPTLKVTGICFVRSQICDADIPDGMSNTCLLGEKYLSPDDYFNGKDSGDNESMYNGFCVDVNRFGIEPPLQDTPFVRKPLNFGSPHPGSCHIAFCDGSVRSVGYSIDIEVHRASCNRRDATPDSDAN